MSADLGSTWRVVYLQPDSTEREVHITATEAWIENGQTAFLHRRIVGETLITETVLQIPTEQVVSYKRVR